MRIGYINWEEQQKRFFFYQEKKNFSQDWDSRKQQVVELA